MPMYDRACTGVGVSAAVGAEKRGKRCARMGLKGCLRDMNRWPWCFIPSSLQGNARMRE